MTTSACPTCGTELTRDGSRAGLCPVCLITSALSDAPIVADPREGPSSVTLPAGTRVGPFRIVGVLGTGGMATVYRAHDVRLEREIALKVLPPEFLHDVTFAGRFEKEARVIARLEHRNIVPIYASGIDDGIPWMSMRLLAGGTMGTLLQDRPPDRVQAVRMLRDIARALDYAHSRGVVHRDIKPTNIFLDDSGDVCVGDFGLAQMLERGPKLTQTGMLSGTPHYMAPEQILGHTVDHRCDIYSLGIVAYELFAGAMPFTGDSPVAVLMKHVNEPLPVPPDGVVSAAVMRAIHRAVEKRPEDRWPSAGAFVDGLDAASGVASVMPAPHDISEATARRTQPGVMWIAAAGAALMLVTGLTWFASREAPPLPPPAPESGRPSNSVQPSTPPPVLLEATSLPPNKKPPVRPTSLVQRASPPPPQNTPAPAVEPIPSPPGAQAENAAAQTSTPVPVNTAETGAGTNADGRQPVAAPASPPVADVLVPAKRIKSVDPVYPALLRKAEIEGDVHLLAVVGPDGKVAEVTVVQSSNSLLDAAAKTAALKYEYTPATRNGVPESAQIIIPVQFRIRR